MSNNRVSKSIYMEKDIKIAERRRRNKLSARESRNRKKKLDSQRDNELEMKVSVNKKLEQKVKKLESLKQKFEQFKPLDSQASVDVSTSDACRLIPGESPEILVDKTNLDFSFNLQLPTFVNSKEKFEKGGKDQIEQKISIQEYSLHENFVKSK